MTTQRMIAALAAVPLVVVLVAVAWLTPLPYATYSPGPTLDVLGKNDGREIVQVSGEKTYRDGGQLRMTTVSVSRPRTRQSLLELVGTWLNRSDAVYPYKAVYPDDETQEESQQEGQLEMSTSQQSAEVAAFAELGYDVAPVGVQVSAITPGSPSDGVLAEGDRFEKVGGTAITGAQQVIDAVQAAPDGEAVSMVVLRDGKRETVEVTPTDVDGTKKIGISIGPAYDFPFAVSVGVDPAIGGPSAGLMFSLAIYDTLTPGSLTDDGVVAGTGTIDSTGTVGPIGGIQQKIVGARNAGAQLFMVPADNCADAAGAHHGDMRLVKATTMHDARTSIEAWATDHDAKLPTCGGDSRS
jgi:PDZ domain-containing protein